MSRVEEDRGCWKGQGSQHGQAYRGSSERLGKASRIDVKERRAYHDDE